MLLISDSEESEITLTKTTIDTTTNIVSKDPTSISLPGILQSISIGGEILWDTAGDKGSKDKKITKGYKEKIVTINLILLREISRTSLHILDKIIGENPNTPYKVLEELERLFKETEGVLEGSKPSAEEAVSIMPTIYVITNDHINSRGINAVCFTSLNSSENSAKDYITVSLTFEEFDFTTYGVSDTVEESADKSPI